MAGSSPLCRSTAPPTARTSSLPAGLPSCKPPATMPTTTNGNCVTVFTGGHLSYPQHNNFPHTLNKFFYAVGNGAQSLHR